MLCKIGQLELELYKIREVAKAVSMSNEAIRKKETRGKVPTTKLRNKQGERLYSIEDIGMYEYFFKHMWSKRQGVRVPARVNELVWETFSRVRKEVMSHGRLKSFDILMQLEDEFSDVPQFNAASLYEIILKHRGILSDEKDIVKDPIFGLFGPGFTDNG